MNIQLKRTRSLVALAAAAVLFIGTAARADEWNERTELTFSEAVMIPGATLQPGTYIFSLADSKGTRHLVQVRNKDSREMVTLTQAVPTKRMEIAGDVILAFNPTDGGPPALKAWYYPGSRYGHEFVYPEEQAKQIAERSKSIVLSVDIPDTDLERGTLNVYHPTGSRTPWQGDADTNREWETWQRERAVVRTAQGAPATAENEDENDEARAPMMAGTGTATRVEIDELEDNTVKYLDKTISVDAEVEEVYGPRLFTIDEPNWGDLDGEILVYAPSMLAALVKDDDRITVTGTMKTMAITEIEKEWGWFELEPEIEVEFLNKPVLVADRIVGGDDNVAMFISLAPSADSADTAARDRTVMDLGTIGEGSTDLVGRHVDVKNVRVLQPATGGGFFIDAPGAAVFVLPSPTLAVTVAPGDTVNLRGAIAETPGDMRDRLNAPSGWNDRIYIVASTVGK